jgi:uncharacterized protein YlxW (UPF0749 family)
MSEQGEPDLGGVDVFFPDRITRPTIEEVTRKQEQGEPDLDAICQDLQEKTYTQAMRIAELEEALAQQRKQLTYSQRFEIITRWRELYASEVNAAEMLIAMTEAAHGIGCATTPVKE